LASFVSGTGLYLVLASLSSLQGLYICDVPPPEWQGNIENVSLHRFTAVKNVWLSEYVVQAIVRALHDLVEGRTTEVLPNLHYFE
jgi:hypothetical protein